MPGALDRYVRRRTPAFGGMVHCKTLKRRGFPLFSTTHLMLFLLPILTVIGSSNYASASSIAMQVLLTCQVDYAVDGFPYTAPFSRYSDRVGAQQTADDHQVCFANTCLNTSYVAGVLPELGLGLSAYLDGHRETLIVHMWKQAGIIDQMTFSQKPTTYNNTTVEIGGCVSFGLPISLDDPVLQIRKENGEVLSRQEFDINYDDQAPVTIPAPLYDHLVELLGGSTFECSDVPKSLIMILVGSTWLDLKLTDFVVRNDGKCKLKATPGDVFSIDAISDHYTLGFDLEEQKLWLAYDLNDAITRTDLMIYGGGALSCIAVLVFAFITFSPHRHHMQLAEDEENKI